MKNLCSDITPNTDKVECDADYENKMKVVKFNPETMEVYDEFNNYLGKGEIKDGILVITKPAE